MVDVLLKRARNNKKDKFGRISLKTGFSARSRSRAGRVFWECGGKHTPACLSVQQQAESEQQTLKTWSRRWCWEHNGNFTAEKISKFKH